MDTTLLDNTSVVNPDGKPLTKLDKEDLVLVVLAKDVKPVKIVSTGRQVAFLFIEDEIKEITTAMLTSTPVMVDFHRVASALELWRNAIVMMKQSK